MCDSVLRSLWKGAEIMPPVQSFAHTTVPIAAGFLANRRSLEESLEGDPGFIERLGKACFPTESWLKFSDDQVTKLYDLEIIRHETGVSILAEEVRKMLANWTPDLPAEEPDVNWLDICIALTACARISLYEEWRRRSLSRMMETALPLDTEPEWSLPKAV
jgi:hypothetical protein